MDKKKRIKPRVLNCSRRQFHGDLVLQTASCHVQLRRHTVDGQNPAPVDMVNIPLFIGFHTSQVVQDFFHQQYEQQQQNAVKMTFH